MWVDIGTINAAQGKIFEIYFNQTQQKRIKFDGLMQYKSKDGYARVLRLYPIDIDTILPEFIPQEVSTNFIKAFMKNKEHFKRIQGFGIPRLEDLEKAQSLMENKIEKYNFLQISKINKENTYMSFYFAKTEVKSGETCEIILVPQIKKNVLAFYCCSPYEHIVVNILRQLSFDFQNLIREENLLEKDQNLINLNCVKCGNVLDIFPPQNEFVACRFCQLLQKPW
jgi:ribosomal protein S27E